MNNLKMAERAEDTGTDSDTREDGRTRILNAAEHKFAETGYFGTGLREIALAADVPLSLIYHHFSNKEELFRQVIMRRADTHVAALCTALDAVKAASGERPVTVEDVIRAYVGPVLAQSANGGPGWKSYVQLLGRVQHSRQYDDFLKPLIEIYDPVTMRFVDAIRGLYPHASEERLQWCFYFLQSAFIHVVVESGLVDRQSAGLCRSSDLLRLLDEMVPFFAAGFEARLGPGRS